MDDPVDRAIRTRAIFVGILGFGVCGASGVRVAATYGLPIWTVPLFALGGAFVGVGGLLAFVHGSGRVAQQLYAPSGASTPRKAEYSYAESLAVRGDHEGAVNAYELCVSENPADPTPYLCIARIYRDGLKQFTDAERWFKRMPREATVDRGMDVLARRELIELYRVKMGAPTRAAPVLARMAEEYEGSPEGSWAAQELAEVKALIAESRSRD